ncbi:MAG: DUF1517 domain-containing protein, partial [Myxococcota bacterium]|nr:DUF1517 domain-containing protein [Myxococcota bacterium]
AQRRGAAGALPPPGGQGWQSVDLTRVRVVVPAERRAALQRALASRVRAAQTSRRMIARMLRDTCDDLRGFEDEWLYGDVASYRPMSAPVAEARYRRLSQDARAALREGTPDVGQGVMLVTIVTAARDEIPDVKPGRDGVTKVLRVLSRLPEDAIVALDLSWTPTRDDAHVSTLELEALHPDLTRLHPAA